MKLIVCATHTHTSLKTLLDGEGSNLNTAVSILNEFLPEGKKYEELVTVDDSVITPLEAGEFVTDKVALAAKKLGIIEKKLATPMNLDELQLVCVAV